jgi:phage FluMu protein Com
MAVDLESTTMQSKEKWTAKWVNRSARKEYLEAGKASTVAKCPKCDVLHETYIKWTGRGMPRIYCTNCRPMVAAINDASGFGAASEYGRIARKGTPQSFD